MIASPHLKWFGLALLSAVQFMVVLDIAIVNVAPPSIQTDLHFSQENLQWVVSAYALAFGGFLLLGGSLVAAWRAASGGISGSICATISIISPNFRPKVRRALGT